MYDPEVIVYIFPAEGEGYSKARDTIEHDKNAALRLRRRPAAPLDPSSRASTQDPEAINEIPELEDLIKNDACLRIPFNAPSRTIKGQVAGHDSDCEIFILPEKGVSRRHFALRYDGSNRLVVEDLHSSNGTRMLYGPEYDSEAGFGKAFSAEGPPFLKGRHAVIKLLPDLCFKLVVPAHDISSTTYLANVKRFRDNVAPAEDVLSGLELKSVPQTQIPTPSSGGFEQPLDKGPGAILWTETIGAGGFGKVHYAWDVTTRAEYARKKPLRDGLNQSDREAWVKESRLLKELRHENILRLLHSNFDGNVPELFFEYVHMGTLTQHQRDSSVLQRSLVVHQVFKALEYLHGLNTPIAHRDIKPDNILVEAWGPGDVHIKLGDFGLSKHEKFLKTLCGTPEFVAPEAWNGQSRRNYTCKVDIWAVGVLTYWLETGTVVVYSDRRYHNNGTEFAKKVIQCAFLQVQDGKANSSGLLPFAIEEMLIESPILRKSASECRLRAESLVAEAEDFFEQTQYLTGSEFVESEEGQDQDDTSQSATPKAIPPIQRSGFSKYLRSNVDIPTVDMRLLQSLAEKNMAAVDSFLGIKEGHVPGPEVDSTSLIPANKSRKPQNQASFAEFVRNDGNDKSLITVRLGSATQIKRRWDEVDQ